MNILVVDDEEIKRVTLTDDLVTQRYAVTSAASGEKALALLQQESFDLVITDLRMPGMDGIELIRKIEAVASPMPSVIIMTAYGTIPLAVEAMQLGAFDFITKPFANDKIFPLIQKIMKSKGLPNAPVLAASPLSPTAQIIGISPTVEQVRKSVKLCGRTDATVLITGETGTGKDLVASVIHQLSARQESPFIKVSCAVFSQTLIESELYGHKKGSFSGADRDKQGRFSLAAGGTVYLDDIDDIPLEQQVKLLRVIEEKTYEPVGGTSLQRADVRIIASTKKSLLSLIADESFRSDLYYRLNVLRVDVPPLRQRTIDIPALAYHFMQQIAAPKPCEISAAILNRLASHTWPGNIRELYHVLERSYLVGEGVVTLAQIEDDITARTPAGGSEHDLAAGVFDSTVKETESQLLRNAMQQADGNKSVAARVLGMKPSTFRDKLSKYGLM